MAKKTFRDINSVKELIYWSYANLAMAHFAITRQETRYSRMSFIIRGRLFKGLMSGTMNIATLLDDEKIKVQYSEVCAYCGKSTTDISIDHIIPQIRKGSHSADNLIRVCRKCNSSKGGRDLMAWHIQNGNFPSILILRRYLKLVYQYCCVNDILDLTLDEALNNDLPFDIKNIPIEYPSPDKLVLYKSEI